jgi:glyoxylase-like metal-dependent hydrolase (beta-lactamase superfamily II)
MLHRRRFVAPVLVLALAVVCAAGTSFAKAPFARGQAPGWYRRSLGDFEVTALLDGTMALPIEKFLTNTTPARIAAALAKVYLKPPFETSFNCYLINTGTKLVLIDAGAGALLGPTLGKLVSNLKASGYQPEQVDEIYLTHMHIDHVGSLVANGKLAFPNAVLRAAKAEGEQWLSQANLDKAPEDDKEGYKGVMASVNPYVSAGKYQPFEGKTELVPGITALPTVGHTNGHTIYVVESKGQKLVLWGDLMHVAAVQFPEPGVTILADTDSKKAAAERKRAFAEAAKQGTFVGVAHVPFPGLGQLRAEGRGYRWVPVNYSAGN